MSTAPPPRKLFGEEASSEGRSSLLLPRSQEQCYRFSRFQLNHVSQSAAVVMYGDVCKETCKSPTPTTCKLECHSGAPFTDLQEEVPEALVR